MAIGIYLFTRAVAELVYPVVRAFRPASGLRLGGSGFQPTARQWSESPTKKDGVDAALKRLLRNSVVPMGLRENFPLHPALRLRLRAGLSCFVPTALVFVQFVPL